MGVELTFFEQLLLILIGTFAAFASGLVTWYLKKNEEAKRKIEENIKKIDDRTLRQSNALMDLGDYIDHYKNDAHPDKTTPNFFDRMNRKLRDKQGNL